MYPVLLELGPIKIHTYGFLIAIGFLAGVSVIKRLAARSHLNVDRVVDLSFWLLLVGFVGARILFVITRWEYFSSDLLGIFRVWEGGFVFFGGLISSTILAVWYVRKHRLPVWKMMDAMVPGLVLAHAFGRLGCLSAGCCYGRPTGTEFGIRLHSELVDYSLRGIPLHPTQLYESSALFVLFFILLFLFKRRVFDGQVILSYFIAYPIIRSIIEIFRGDIIRGFVIDDILSTSQFISIIVLTLAAIALVARLKQVKENKT